MKTKAILFILVLGLAMPNLAMRQTEVKRTKVAEKAIEAYKKAINKYEINLDSLIIPSLERARSAYSRAAYNTPGDNYFQLYRNSRNSTLSFRKEFDTKSNIERSYEMEFEKDQKSLDFRVSASVEEGRMLITIIKPNGKNYKTLEIDGKESLSWNHTINVNPDDEQKYIGTWEVRVSASTAIGNYNVNINIR